MATTTRKLFKIFAKDSSWLYAFNNETMPTNDPDLIQNADYLTGFDNATNGGIELPSGKNFESVYFNEGSAIKHLYEYGIPHYLSTEEYGLHARTIDPATGKIYISLDATNLGNALTDNTKWKLLDDASNVLTTIGDLLYHNGTQIVRLPRGNDGQILRSTPSSITWSDNILNTVPFSTNDAKVDANGRADFIQKDSPTQITILAGGLNPNVRLTSSNNSQYVISSNIIVPVDTYNGLYKIIYENGVVSAVLRQNDFTANTVNGNPTLSNVIGIDWSKVVIGQVITGVAVATTGVVTVLSFNQIAQTITMSSNATANGTGTAKKIDFLNVLVKDVLPTSPVQDGMYVTIVNPLKSYKRIAGSFVETQYNELGHITKTGGDILIPTNSYFLNGKTKLIQETLTSSNLYSSLKANTGLPMEYYYVDQIFQMKSAQAGYVVGEYIDPSNENYFGLSDNSAGFKIFSDDLESIKIITGSANAFEIGTNGSTNVVSYSNVRLILTIKRNF